MESQSNLHPVGIHSYGSDYENEGFFSSLWAKFKCIIYVVLGLIVLLIIYLFVKPSSSTQGKLQKEFKLDNLKKHYDVLLVGAGLFNAVLSNHFISKGKSVLVLERRNHIAGNCYTERKENIDVHIYGPHIFHTDSKEVWDYVNNFTEFNSFVLNPIAFSHGKIYNLPFNMHTFYQLYGTQTPDEAKQKIKEEVEKENIKNPKNLEEQAISMVGRTMYETLIKEYTEKQWGRNCTEIDPNVIKRLPLRFTFNNNYFNDRYQGIPIEGYTEMILKMYKGADVFYNIDYLKDKEKWDKLADKIFYSGCIDEYYNYEHGVLEYRKVEFKTKTLDVENFQGAAVKNYPDKEFPYTRVIEHKHFNDLGSPKTIVTEEYSSEWKKGEDPFYPVNNERNLAILKKYQEIKNNKVTFVGRLGMYKYFDMDDTVAEALKLIKTFNTK